jgi:hypothetical protein
MFMKKLSFLALFVVLIISAAAQTTSSRRFTKEELLKAEQAHQSREAANMASNSIASDYFGFDKEIKNITRNGLIPSDFPKADPTITKEKYTEVANDWISKNPTYIKPEYLDFKFNTNTK